VEGKNHTSAVVFSASPATNHRPRSRFHESDELALAFTTRPLCAGGGKGGSTPPSLPPRPDTTVWITADPLACTADSLVRVTRRAEDGP